MEDDRLIYIKKSIEEIGDYKSDSFSKDIEDLINDFFNEVINNSSDHFKKIITNNISLINKLLSSFDKDNVNKNEKIKKLKEFLFTLILDKYIKAFNHKVDDVKKHERYSKKKDKYGDIEDGDKHWKDLLELAKNFGIKTKDELKKFFEEKDNEKNPLKELLIEFGFKEDIANGFVYNDIMLNDIDSFYEKFSKLKEKEFVKPKETKNLTLEDIEKLNKQNKQHYIMIYIDVNNPNSEYYIEDKNVRDYFLLNLDVFICENLQYDIIQKQLLIKEFKKLCSGINVSESIENNLMDIIFEISIKHSKYYIKKECNMEDFIKLCQNNMNYINDLHNNYNNIHLKIIFVQGLVGINNKDNQEVEQFKEKFKQNIDLVFNGAEENMQSYMLDLIKYLNDKKYDRQKIIDIVNNFKEIKESLIENKDALKNFSDYIINICDSNSKYYIETAEDRKNVITELINRKKIRGFKDDKEIKGLILLQKGLMVFDEDVKDCERKEIEDKIQCVDVKDLTIQMLNQEGEKYAKIIKELKNGNYKIIPNNEGGASSNKFKIINTEGKPIYYFKFFDSKNKTTDIGSSFRMSKNNLVL